MLHSLFYAIGIFLHFNWNRIFLLEWQSGFNVFKMRKKVNYKAKSDINYKKKSQLILVQCYLLSFSSNIWYSSHKTTKKYLY